MVSPPRPGRPRRGRTTGRHNRRRSARAAATPDRRRATHRGRLRRDARGDSRPGDGGERLGPVRGRRTEIVVEEFKHQAAKQVALLGIDQDREADVLRGDHDDDRLEAEHRTTMRNDACATIVGDVPAERVVVFDAVTITGHVTCEKPDQLATGVTDVLIIGGFRLAKRYSNWVATGRVVRGRSWTGAPGGAGCRASASDWSWKQ